MSQDVPIAQIKCPNWDEMICSSVISTINRIIANAKQNEILPISLKKIIITENYEQEYDLIAQQYGLTSKLSNEVEYKSVAKICVNKKVEALEYTLLMHSDFLNNDNFEIQLNKLLLLIKAEDLLPNELKGSTQFYSNTPISQITSIFFRGLFELLYIHFRMPVQNCENILPPIPAKNIISPFKRKVKKLHLKYQSDDDFDYCVVYYYETLNTFLKRYVEIMFYQIDYTDFGEFSSLLMKLKQGLVSQFQKIVNQESYSLVFLEDVIIEISKLCFLEITKYSTSIKVIENPKKLFPDMVDTHQRIVAFVDILGFSNLIKNFDLNSDVQLLIDMKESLDLAIEKMHSTFQHSEVESKLFSDCLCLSVPFFDNDHDLPRQFSAIMLGLKTYQSLLLVKGYLIRGGVTIGSYYSDQNMIFSGALVRAVDYEKNGTTSLSIKDELKPPRILVCPQIIEKLHNTRIQHEFHRYYIDGLIQDSNQEVFINPLFNLTTSATVYDEALQTFEHSEDEYIKALSPVMSSAVEFIKSFMSPQAEMHMINTILDKMDEKINVYSKEPFVRKYEWMKGLVKWIGSARKSDVYSLYNIEFKEII